MVNLGILLNLYLSRRVLIFLMCIYILINIIFHIYFFPHSKRWTYWDGLCDLVAHAYIRTLDSSNSYLALRHTLQEMANTQVIGRNTSPLQDWLHKTTPIRCQQTLPMLLAKTPQRRPNNIFASVAASTYPAWVTINTYCLGISTEGLLGDLRVLASIEVKRKVGIPQNIWKRNTGFWLCM